MVRCSVAALLLVAVMAAAAAAGVTSTFYGYIKLDASYDSAMTNDGDFVYVVLPYAEGEEDDEFNMTAKQTRLGLKLKGGGSDAVDVSGVFEMDFYGSASENKSNPMIRKAYMVLKTDMADILAGQTSDVISPIVPTTLNYIVLWESGDIGYRRPQIRLSKSVQVGGGSSLGLELAATRGMGSDAGGAEKLATPGFQGRLSFGTDIMGHAAVLGVSTLMGKEEVAREETDVYDLTAEVDQSAVAVDVTLPLGDMLALKGQYFTGRDLKQYLGGVGQDVAVVESVSARSYEIAEIEASGWWAQLTADLADGWQVNAGVGMDDPDVRDSFVDGRYYDKNTTYFGNVLWTVAPAAVVGVEYSMFETEYATVADHVVTTESYQDSRVQLSFTYSF